MARGGKRPGAGRKPGGRNRKTREIADRVAADGITPLEVMIRAMREHFLAQRWDEAAAVAKDAAPYMHPRLAAIEHTGANGGPIETRQVIDLSKLTDEELVAYRTLIAATQRDREGDRKAGMH